MELGAHSPEMSEYLLIFSTDEKHSKQKSAEVQEFVWF